MSNLTPDGDPTRDATVTIRSFPNTFQPSVSSNEFHMLKSWAATCNDPEKAAKLKLLLGKLSIRQ